MGYHFYQFKRIKSTISVISVIYIFKDTWFVLPKILKHLLFLFGPKKNKAIICFMRSFLVNACYS